MKKTIALFLVAALIGVGLIVSCSDDPEPKKEDPSVVKYSVIFDANGGELAAGTPIVLSVEAGKTITSAKWPADPVKTSVFDYGIVEDDFNGWFDGTTKYAATTPINKDVTLVASYSPFVKPVREAEYVTALGWFTWENNPTTQRGWRANGADNAETSLEWADIAEARYIVLHTKKGFGKDWETGFGGIQIVAQGDGSSWGWDQTDINSFFIPRDAGKDVFIAIDLTTLKNYTKFVRGTIGKFLIAYYDGVTNATGLGLQQAYLTNIDLKPKTSVLLANNQNKIGGFATDDDVLKLLGITPPTDTKTVTFDINYTGTGVVSPAAEVVATNTPLNLQYRDVERPGFTFLGWFNGSGGTIDVDAQAVDGFDITTAVAGWGTKYEPTTKITANVTLKAGWLEQNWPVIKNTEKQAGNTSEWSINGKFPFKYFIIASVGGGTDEGFGGVQFGIQGDGVSQKVRTTGDWTSLAHTTKDIVYFIIDLTQYEVWNASLFSASWSQFRINYGADVLGVYQGYIVDDGTTLTKPAGASDFGGTGSAPGNPDGTGFLAGYVTKTLPAELQ